LDVSLREDAVAIWKAGVAAVDSERLVTNNIFCTDDILKICGQEIPLQDLNRIEVVGAGKAGTGMARGVLHALRDLPPNIPLTGWVNVPADCVQELPGIHLHPARPAGVNEPTVEGVAGTEEILRRVSALNRNDLCIVLISGGGSALLPAPVPQVTLADKLTTSRILASHGAPIHDLNIVRSRLSRVKGGGLLARIAAGRVITLIISDVVGDPLDIIASGPTVMTNHSPNDALDVLQKYDPDGTLVPAEVYEWLRSEPLPSGAPLSAVQNFVIGSNNVAMLAAAAEAEKRGYRVLDQGTINDGDASRHGEQLFRTLSKLRGDLSAASEAKGTPLCVLAGGETTVQLAETDPPGKGGRNQEAVLAAINAAPNPADWQNIVLLSGGTDGEDGPTDAAGAFADSDLLIRMQKLNLSPSAYLRNNNSYPFFQQLDGLLMTGPTHTNVMDLAVGIVGNQP
jgi:glycerate 2-kinase